MNERSSCGVSIICRPGHRTGDTPRRIKIENFCAWTRRAMVQIRFICTSMQSDQIRLKRLPQFIQVFQTTVTSSAKTMTQQKQVDLPSELWIKVLKNVDLKDLWGNARLVCRPWNHEIKNIARFILYH